MILLRHGESEFNVIFSRTRVDPGIEDPSLTELGRQQAQAAADVLRNHDIRRILASPYSRTLQTAEIVARTLGVPVDIEPRVREHKHFICDTGTPTSQLAANWPDWRFDALAEQWWPEDSETDEDVRSRAGDFLADIEQISEWRHVAAITHWGFIRGMTGLRVINCTAVRIDASGGAVVVLSPLPC